MKRFWYWFYIIPILGCIGLSVFVSYCVITSMFGNWKVLLDFNSYHEGLAEAIVFPLFCIMGLWGLYKLTHR